MTKLPVRRQRMRPDEPRLSREDWLDAAHAAVVEGGFDRLRVQLVARALRVSRGSFYWHFSGQAEWQAELLERWRSRQFAVERALQAGSLPDPQADLAFVLDTALAQIGADAEHMRFELALRGLGRRDEGVARLLAEVDAMRLQIFHQRFLRLTGDAAKAGELALLFYLAVVGCYQALSRPANPPQLKDYLTRVITRYLIEQQLPAAPGARPRAVSRQKKG